MRIIPELSVLTLVLLLVMSMSATAKAEGGDAFVQYSIGLAARDAGDTDKAYKFFKKSCMASSGMADACLAWGEMAAAADNAKDVKRALGSAVMLNPNDIRARFALAVFLMKKQDWVWAEEHLSGALPNARTTEDRSLLRYYLGYTKLKTGEFEEAARYFALASRSLPPQILQKCRYYRGLLAIKIKKPGKAFELFEAAASGPDQEVKSAALAQIKHQTAFPRIEGIGGQLIASLGLNTHPAASFLESSDSKPVLQSVFRGDLMVGTRSYEHGVFGALTVYRDQNWAELGSDDGDAQKKQGTTNNMIPGNMDLTLFILQGAYIWRGFKGGVEQEIRLGLDGEMQFLDRLPKLDDTNHYNASKERFELYTWAEAQKLWWSWSAKQNSTWSARFKIEHRPNYIDKDRSTNRFRLRLLNTRRFLDKTLQVKFLLGGRYDRAYKDLSVIKYDRLLPEFSIDAKWKTPVSRLTLLCGAKVKYNWYLNSKFNKDNSFRPGYQKNPQYNNSDNELIEAYYYNDLSRHDFEWEITTEAQLRMWSRASLGLRYYHHQRISNMDFAPRPMAYDSEEGWHRIWAADYGYKQDIVVLELRQGF